MRVARTTSCCHRHTRLSKGGKDHAFSKGSLGHAYTFRILTGNGDINIAFGLLLPRMISVHAELRFRTPALSFYRCAAPAKLPIWHLSQEYLVSPGGDESRAANNTSAERLHGLLSKRVDQGKQAAQVRSCLHSPLEKTQEAACRSQFT